MSNLQLMVIARIPANGIEAFQAYEDQALPIIAEYGGTLERRLRIADGTVEVHLISFPSSNEFGRFRLDERRAALQSLLAESGAQVEVYPALDVT